MLVVKTPLIINPTSGPGDNELALEELIKALEEQGFSLEVSFTTPDEDGQGLAAQAAQAGAPLVIVAGGDGTLEAAARGLLHTQTALGIIPFGTRNNLSASLKIPSSFAQAAQIVAQGDTQAVDAGRVGDHFFIEVVGIGLEAALFPCGEDVKAGVQKRGLLGFFRGLLSGLTTFYQFRPHRLILRLDGRRVLRLRSLQVNICNSPRYGIEFSLAPDARMDDGKLDVVFLHNGSKWEHLRLFFSAMRGDRPTHARLETYPARRIEVSSRTPLEVHADGVCLGFTPVTVEVVPSALRVRVPTPELLAAFAAQQNPGSSELPELSAGEHKPQQAQAL